MHEILKNISYQIYKELNHKELVKLVKEAVAYLQESQQLKGNWHPLGFIHIPLGTFNNQSIRLHVWSPKERREQQPFFPIHTHIFELKSHILSGSLKNATYKVNSSDSTFKSIIYDVEYSKSGSNLKKTTKKINFEKCKEENLTKGDFYSVRRGEFHSSKVNKGDFTATIALTYNKTNETPLVIGEINGKEEYSYYRNNCNHEELLDIISYLEQI
ncbi:hypothetical protein CN978_30475 [Priestia megaterium]|uniref:hypothetical protein n=1 Tax=Priestia megaterium TaxID=1404 RepID=UPI000BFC978F|nr:hypothetical protein [Priestia megaterium]PGN53610.1 hypothetical protein CN978_30475 [Priestia megaterium]PGQ87667.1 hypothetical protein COA18_07505 [Priestia megaterium]